MKKLRIDALERNQIHQALDDYLKKCDIFEPKYTLFEPVKDNVEIPKIYITNDAHAKMLALVDASNVEIAWHGLVEREGNVFIIKDIIMFPQINSATHTTSTQDEYANWITEQMLLDMDKFKLIRMHGHSHVNMDVFSSGTDDKYQSDIIRNIEEGDYYIFLIVNKKRQVAIFLYDFLQQYLFTSKEDKLHLQLLLENPEGYDTWAKEQIKEFVSTPAPRSKENFRYTPPEENELDFFFRDEWYNNKYRKKGKKK